MMHKTREFVVTDVDDAFAAELAIRYGYGWADSMTPDRILAKSLVDLSWTRCTGFRLNGLLYLNDSISEGGAQEYAVVRESDMLQIESITFSWCSEEEALDHFRFCEQLAKEDLPKWHMGFQTAIVIHNAKEHERCRHCA